MIPSTEEFKKKRYCKYHNSNTITQMIAKSSGILSSRLSTKGKLGWIRLKVVCV